MTTTATGLRCPHCLMPTKVAEGIVAPHDFPYAVTNYGQCKGSGQSALTGPATPPTVWGYEERKTFVELGVLPSPMPTVERDGWVVTISGVRFTHSTHCAKCRVVVHTATDGGVIQLGFDHKGRAFEKERPGARPTYDGPCPNGCGHRVVIGHRHSDPTRAMPVAEGRTVESREWERLRRDLKVCTVDMNRDDLARLRT
ncbi:hypothetical protein [Streptomyces sp. NPDC015125]|uniref:hypothetical protein n=1 Tax=Streptomyces sp. NPDC015125 TaxID=3364938 RepID=UPI00370190C2